MEFGNLNNLAISVAKQGPTTISKASFPLRYGKYSEIKTPEYEFRFNLNGEIKFIRGLNMDWPHPAEQLKRTDGNDWVYYSVGDDSSEKGQISWLGEYYLPCLPYSSNSIWEVDYFANPGVMNAFAAWSQLYANLYGAKKDGLHARAKDLINQIIKNDDQALHERSQKLQTINAGRVSVLPPDTRHVDYETIPLMIADGCLYHCDFCCVKSAKKFQTRSRNDIIDQIKQLKHFYGPNLENYHSLFLGNHDALASGANVICTAVSEASNAFGFASQHARTPFLYLFGSVASLLKSENDLFEKLNQLPFYTYINIGFESLDTPTLEFIGKPLNTSRVQAAFQKMLDINNKFASIEITGNFLLGQTLPAEHYQSLTATLSDVPVSSHGKGSIYLSPLKDSPKKRELLPQFMQIKEQSRLPVFIYLIQRL